jgi:hypothetical protein
MGRGVEEVSLRYLACLAVGVLIQACSAEAQTPDPASLSGYWLSCANGEQVSETWSDPRGGVTLGVNFTLNKGRASWEILRIAPSSKGQGVSLFAAPSSQPPEEFPLSLPKSTQHKLVFENLAHDFPQRVIYERVGEKLNARIEGMMGGKLEAMDWSFSAAKLNEGCR